MENWCEIPMAIASNVSLVTPEKWFVKKNNQNKNKDLIQVATIRPEDPLLRFEGYVSQGDTQKKIITDCQRPGDNVFTSGDILHWDRLGYLYFRVIFICK